MAASLRPWADKTRPGSSCRTQDTSSRTNNPTPSLPPWPTSSLKAPDTANPRCQATCPFRLTTNSPNATLTPEWEERRHHPGLGDPASTRAATESRSPRMLQGRVTSQVPHYRLPRPRNGVPASGPGMILPLLITTMPLLGGYCHLWFTVMTADGRRWLAGSSGALPLNGVMDDFVAGGSRVSVVVAGETSGSRQGRADGHDFGLRGEKPHGAITERRTTCRARVNDVRSAEVCAIPATSLSRSRVAWWTIRWA